MSAQNEFWDRLADVRAGLMEVDGRLFPMSPSCAPEDGCIWFLTAHGTDAADAAKAGSDIRFAISDTRAGLHGSVEGTLEISHDQEKLDEVWNFVAASWYEDGKDDKDLVLARMIPRKAELWLSTQSGAVFLYETLKANLTDTQPDMGRHVTVTF